MEKELTFDSLVFDMDGTLWDAVDSYCTVWDSTFADLGIDSLPVKREVLVGLMGLPLEEIVHRIAPQVGSRMTEFMERLSTNEDTMMPGLGGKLYGGVEATLCELKARGVRLFMVSNCSARGLDNFMDFTGLRPLFEGKLSYGETGRDKDYNIRTLVDGFGLQRPAYVGDIQRDADAAHAAGVPMVWASYGFGKVSEPEYTINNFDELLNLVKPNGE